MLWTAGTRSLPVEKAVGICPRTVYDGQMPRILPVPGTCVLVLLVGLVGCVSFDRTGVEDDPSCSQDIAIAITVNGQTSDDSDASEPLTRVLVGDTVTLSASSSCVRRGPMTVHWDISPDREGIEDTAQPNRDSPEITVIPLEPDMYSVKLEVTDGDGHDETLAIQGFEVIGWKGIDPFSDGAETVRDMAVGTDQLFLSTDQGLFVASLATPEITPYSMLAVSGAQFEEPLPLLYDAAPNRLWVGPKSSVTRTVWRVDLDSKIPVSTAVPFSDGRVLDFAVTATGVLIATDKGIYQSLDPASTEPISTVQSNALAVVSGELWAGTSSVLVSVGDEARTVDVFPNSGDAIATLAADGGTLWIGSQNRGVARYDPVAGGPPEVFSGLLDDQIRALTIETSGPFSGDVWAATSRGVMRFKKDRGIWIDIDPSGASGRTNLLSLAVDTVSGSRAVYAGSTNGLVYMRVPREP